MKILFVASELEGLAKTGGLADVARALPEALQDMGHDVRIVMPYYREVAEKTEADQIGVEQTLYADKTPYRFNVQQLREMSVPVYCVDHTDFFDRAGLYSDGYHGYSDNAERFAFFSHAALLTSKAIGFQPDIVHCNDWHTALIPYFLSIDNTGYFGHTKSIFTVHNGAYQGTHKFSDIPYLRTHYDLAEQLDGDALNYLRMAIRYAHKINTVSPNYAKELLTPLGSHNLYHEFHFREKDVSGILNGCDYTLWDPETDVHLPFNYTAESLHGKVVCKSKLQERVGLERDPNVPLIGMVCRLTEQKGFGFLVPALAKILTHKMQLLIVGTGDPEICKQLEEYAAQYPGKFVFYEGFSVELSHLVEAGSDFFLMPSLFEPCGLNQMYSLAYGTLPIVRAVGGLKDTVVDWQDDPENATGFLFEQPQAESALAVVLRALLFFHEFPHKLEEMQQRAMGTRFTWHQAAENYLSLYKQAQENGANNAA